ncbi:MAG TPA: hypothetical protein VFP98_02740 [Candidatus Polarisedimenticolia bacterium]|nr:hypothetical protein [Candidatus Polarisedimenticolia bacterium]
MVGPEARAVGGDIPAICPLCGASVGSGAADCAACPLAHGCSTLCCPRCGYRFVERSATLEFLARVWRRARPGRRTMGGAGR